MSRSSVERIRTALLELAMQREFWNETDYPAPAGDERQNRFLIGQGESGVSLYLNVLCPGKRIPPHNHTTWACIAGVEGVEENTFFDRVDDGSVPGRAEITTREVVVVGPGAGIAMLGEGIHPSSIENAGVLAGMPVGPLAISDEVSMTLMQHIRDQSKKDTEAAGQTWNAHPAEAVIDRMVGSHDRKGKAAGAGFYEYPQSGKKHLWPELDTLFVDREKARNTDLQELKDRILFIQAIDGWLVDTDGRTDNPPTPQPRTSPQAGPS